MPCYKISVDWDDYEEVMNAIHDFLKKKGYHFSYSLFYPDVLIATKNKMKKEDLDELIELLKKKFTSLIKKMTLVHTYPD